MKVNAMINGLSYMKVQLLTYNPVLESVFAYIKDREQALGDFCSGCISGINKGLLFSDAWKDTVKAYTDDSDIQNVLLPLGNILGTAQTEDECAVIDNILQQMKSLSESYMKEYKEKRKLFSRVGLLCGTFIIILLI